MDFKEFTGKDLDEALQFASDSLGIPKEEIEYKVTSQGASGIFGIVGNKKAKIRVPSDYQTEIQEPELSPDIAEPEIQSENLFSDSEDNDIDTPSISGTSQSKYSKPRYPKTKFNDIDLDEAKELGVNFLKELVSFITDDAQITVKERYNRIIFTINGSDSAVLIGRRGQTLDALQYFVEKMINKKSFERIRIQVDVGGYLEKKRVNLKYLALHLAEKAKRTGRPWTTEYMNAHDRRIIHLALRDDNEVRSKSIGTGFLRKMVIIPQRSRY